jgi:parallel beta-helix repeat protein
MKQQISIVLMLTLGLLSAAYSEAKTIHVAKTGHDTNNTCLEAESASTPKLTVNAGLGCLAAGDTMTIHVGTYAEAMLANSIPSGISDGQRTVIQAASGETVWIMPTVTRFIEIYDRDFITLDGINTDGSNATSSVGYVVGNGSSYITIQNAILRDHKGPTPGSGQQHCIGSAGDQGTNHKFLNLEMADCGDHDGDHGIYLTGRNSLIEGCRIHNAYSHGIHEYIGATNPLNNTIRNNTVYNNGYVGIGMYLGSGSVAYNNLVYGNGSDGFKTNGSAYGIYNNTIYNNAGWAINFNANGGHTARNNIFYQNSSGGVNNTSNHTLSNNLTSNPSFINAGAANFHLQSGSSAINAGITVGVVTTDFDAVARPQGAAYDIGAFEFVASGGGGPTGAPGAPSGVTIQ